MELAGSATTLVSADIERIQFGIREVHEIWANAISAAISLFLIEDAIGVSMVPALGVSICKKLALWFGKRNTDLVM
jgi:ATP-binding cassette subfamily C (CFTR/MRP) protein 1